MTLKCTTLYCIHILSYLFGNFINRFACSEMKNEKLTCIFTHVHLLLFQKFQLNVVLLDLFLCEYLTGCSSIESGQLLLVRTGNCTCIGFLVSE